jgi:signal transduction histidine kinase
MAVELAEVAAGLPMAASFALAGGITTLREGRRRTALNEAVHELRRPLQVLSLVLPEEAERKGAADSSLRLATAALERLDREINGGVADAPIVTVAFGRLLEEAAQRWRTQAVLSRGSLELRWRAGEVLVEGDQFELAQLVDNLISNAIEHGGAKVVIEARRDGRWLLVSVIDEGRSASGSRVPSRPSRRGGRCRRGHGLRVVRRVARAHGGSFSLRRSDHGAEARLRLPLYKREAQR